MTDDFDDDALRAAIGSRSGGSVDTGTARVTVIARAKRVRTLRTVAIGGTAVLVLVAGLLIVPNARDTSGIPADQPDVPTPTTPVTTGAPSITVTSSSTSSSTSSTTSSPPGATPSTTAASTPIAPTVPTGSPTTDDPPTTVPTTSPSPPTTAAPANSTPTTSSAPAVADPPFTRRYDSPGGSITVNWNGSALSLVSVDAGTGYQSEIEDQSTTRIRVRFRGDSDVRIEVRARDGRVEHIVS